MPCKSIPSMVRAACCVPLGNTELIPGQKSDPGRSCRIREREAPLVVANSRVVVTGRVVGKPYLTGLRKVSPDSGGIPRTRYDPLRTRSLLRIGE